MRTAVVGAGIGGLTTALALAARGIGCEIYERAPALAEAGAGLQLGPNAVRVLDGLGLGAALRDLAFAPEASEVRDVASGRLLLRVPLGAAAVARWGAPYLQVHRSDLQRLLAAAVEAAGGVALRLGQAVDAAGADGAVRLASGEVRSYDAIIGADGLRSRVAEGVFGREAPRFTGQVAWRAVVEREAVGADIPPVAAVWTGPKRHVVHYPVRGGQAINLVAVVEDDWREEGWRTPGDPDVLRRLFRDWPAPVPALLAAVRETWRWALFDRAPRPRWSSGRATLLGDAAHPMLPFLAQGAAMAIEDAAVLAERLAGGGKVETALAAYARDRQGRTAKVQAWSRRNARLFHLPPPVARAVFGAAGLAGDGAARLNWIYGWRP